MQETMRHTRESWLEAAIDVMRPWFEATGYPLPEKVHISVGFSYGARAESKQVMGCTWRTIASEDNVNHVFISPILGDTFDVLETLLHELIHVADDCENGHRGRFIEIAKALNLQPPWTYTAAPVDRQAELLTLAAALGDYPHGKLDPSNVRVPTPTGGATTVPAANFPVKLSSGPAKQSTRLVKAQCPECGYTVRVTRKWLDKGAPICPTDMVQMQVL